MMDTDISARRPFRRAWVIGGAAAWMAALGGTLFASTLRDGGEPPLDVSDSVPAILFCNHDVPVAKITADALRRGGSVIVATGRLTGRTTRVELDGVVVSEMHLDDVRTLAGPPIVSGSTAWVDGQWGSGASRSGRRPVVYKVEFPAGPLWAPDGRLFGVVTPTKPLGPGYVDYGPLQMDLAPLVEEKVIVSAATLCWNVDGLPSESFSGPLQEIPGRYSYLRAAPFGFKAVPLASVVERLPK